MQNDRDSRPLRTPAAARTTLAAGLALAASLLVAACGSEGSLARKRQASLLDSAMSDDAEVVVLEVFQNTAYVAVTEKLLNDLRHVEGVIDARRGLGSNEAYALVKKELDPQTIVTALDGEGYRAKVVRIVTRETLDAEEKK